MNISQEKLQELLSEIGAKRGGVLYPEDVVAAATDPAHPLHGHFPWNDAEAAHAHRLDIARRIIRSVRVAVHTQRRELTAPFYVSDPTAGAREGGYLAIPVIKSDEERARAAVKMEFSRALAALKRARDISCALDMDQRVDNLIKIVEELAGELTPLKAVGAG